MCNLKFIFSGLIVASVFMSTQVLGKDLTNRLGVGYANQFSIGTPAVAARYYPNPDLGVAAALGIDTNSGSSEFGLGVKVFRIIFKEQNLNFYLGAGGGLISQEVNSVSSSGFELNGFAGVEFFFQGLESLGFIFETGIGIASINSGVRFRTFADHPVNAGIVFYF